jgi:hypothetical protein
MIYGGGCQVDNVADVQLGIEFTGQRYPNRNRYVREI